MLSSRLEVRAKAEFAAGRMSKALAAMERMSEEASDTASNWRCHWSSFEQPNRSWVAVRRADSRDSDRTEERQWPLAEGQPSSWAEAVDRYHNWSVVSRDDAGTRQ